MTHDVYGHIIEVWEPRYRDKKALIGRHHVIEGTNYVTFTRADHLEGKVFRVESSIIESCPVQANGRGEVYCVPMSKLKLVGYLTDTEKPKVEITNEVIAIYLKKQGFSILEQDPEDADIYVQGKYKDLVATITKNKVYFDRHTTNRETRRVEVEEIPYVLPWQDVKDLNFKNIEERISKDLEEKAEITARLTANPLSI